MSTLGQLQKFKVVVTNEKADFEFYLEKKSFYLAELSIATFMAMTTNLRLKTIKQIKQD
tara:strand:+ start:794 stop:970 length:177 start_codon:yes stop_codon:yes gene_type:complete